MTQRYVPVVLSLFMVLGPLGGTALAADAPQAPAVPAIPAAPAVSAPQARDVKVGALTLTGPGNGDTVATRRPVFTGRGAAGDTVTVWPEDGDAYCTATVATDLKWTCTPTRDLPVGQQILAVNEWAPGSVRSKGLVRLRLFVAPTQTPEQTPEQTPTAPPPSKDKPCPENQENDNHQG